MKKLLSIISIALIANSCNQGVEDSRYRNENWAWYLDKDSKEGRWIPVKDQMGIENGTLSMFFSSGELYFTGNVADSIYVDTVKFFNKDGSLLMYQVLPDSNTWYYAEDGPLNFYYKTGERRIIGTVQNQVLTGTVEYFDNLERLTSKRHIVDSIDSAWYYFPNGSLENFAIKINGIRQGISYVWDSNGNLQKEIHWLDGKSDGIQCYYHGKKNLWAYQSYNEGIIEGPTIEYHPNGLEKSLTTWKNNEKHGPSKSYFESGSIMNKGHYEHDKKSGNWTFYYKNGHIHSTGTSMNDHNQGKWEFYYPNGQLYCNTNYYLGNPSGSSIIYTSYGRPYLRSNFKNGSETIDTILHNQHLTKEELEDFDWILKYRE